MHPKIYAHTYDIQIDDDSWDTDIPAWSVDNPKPVSAVQYTRADIAEELARAMERLIDGGCDVKAAKTLAKYRAITP